MENENKPMLNIDTEGNVLRCAKGASSQDCGYKAGDAVCAKCGATPVEVKMVPISADDEEMFMAGKPKKAMPSDQGEMMEEEDMSIYAGEAGETEDDMEEEEELPKLDGAPIETKLSATATPKVKNKNVSAQERVLQRMYN